MRRMRVIRIYIEVFYNTVYQKDRSNLYVLARTLISSGCKQNAAAK